MADAGYRVILDVIILTKCSDEEQLRWEIDKALEMIGVRPKMHYKYIRVYPLPKEAEHGRINRNGHRSNEILEGKIQKACLKKADHPLLRDYRQWWNKGNNNR